MDRALRNKSRYARARELIALGDFNMPKTRKDGTNIVYSALTGGGLVTPEHSGQIDSSIASDNHFDQVAMFPKTTQAWFVDIGVFDYDGVIFRAPPRAPDQYGRRPLHRGLAGFKLMLARHCTHSQRKFSSIRDRISNCCPGRLFNSSTKPQRPA